MEVKDTKKKERGKTKESEDDRDEGREFKKNIKKQGIRRKILFFSRVWVQPCGMVLLRWPDSANRCADSRKSPDSRESFQGSAAEPFSCESRLGG